jgi:integrase
MRYQVRVEGHPTRKTFDTSREARDYAATLRLKRKPTRTMTCGELVDRYNALWKAGNLPHQSAPPKQSTMSTRRQNLALFLAEFADSDVNELDALRVEVWATAHTWAVASVNPIWNYAAKRDIVSHNPFSQYMPKPGEGRRHITPLSDDELERLAEAAQSVWPYGRAFVTWQAYTGMRPSETYALDRPLDISGDVLRITHGVYEGVIDTPKTGPREILLLPQARDALRFVPGISGPLFQSVWGRRLSNRLMSSTYWKKTREAFGRDDIDVYSLRHQCAHLLYVRYDLPAKDVAAQLGNSPRLIENPVRALAQRRYRPTNTAARGHQGARRSDERFAHLRERGEWFRVDPEFADFVSLPLRVPEAEDDGYRYGRVIEPPTVVDGLRPVDQAVLDVLDLERWMRCADVVPLVPGGTRALVVQILRRLGNYGFTQSRTRFTHEPYRQFLEHRRVAAPAVKMSADEAVRLAGLAT